MSRYPSPGEAVNPASRSPTSVISQSTVGQARVHDASPPPLLSFRHRGASKFAGVTVIGLRLPSAVSASGCV